MRTIIKAIIILLVLSSASFAFGGGWGSGGGDTTAAGDNVWKGTNDFTDGSPIMGPLNFTDDGTHPDTEDVTNGLHIYNGVWWQTIAGVHSVLSLGDTPEDTAYGVSWDSNLKAASKNSLYDKIEAITVGPPVTDEPTYSDESCTKGQYAYGTLHAKYECKATDTWDYLTVSGSDLIWAGWSNPTPITYDLTLAVVGDSTLTIDSIDYTSTGSPYTITGLSGDVAITALYGGTDDTLTWTGDTVTGTYGTYSIAMGTADKSVTGTFSNSSTATIDDDFSTDTSANYTAITGGMVVTGGVAHGETNWTTAWLYHQTTTGSNNHYVEGDLYVGSNFNAGGLVIRCNGTTGYSLELTSTPELHIKRFTGDALTTVSSFPIGQALTVGEVYKVRVEVIGSTFQAYIDLTGNGDYLDTNEDIGTVVDTTYLTGQFVGISLNRSGGSDVTVDNLEWDSL